jgi:hypothetical protein
MHASRIQAAIAAAAVVNVALVLAIVGVAAYAAVDLRGQAAKVDEVFALVGEQPTAATTRRINAALGQVGSFFFLGAARGSVAQFLSNLMTFDFGLFASDVNAIALQLAATFNADPQPKQCYSPAPCTNDWDVTCPNGNTFWCRPGSMANCAEDKTCVSPDIASVSSIVESVSRKLVTWERVPAANPTAATPAFSEGIFRLDVLLGWIDAQTNVGQWQAAAASCRGVTAQMRATTWSNTYVDPSSKQTQSWSAASQLATVSSYMDQVCDALVYLSSPRNGAAAAVGDTPRGADHDAPRVGH